MSDLKKKIEDLEKRVAELEHEQKTHVNFCWGPDDVRGLAPLDNGGKTIKLTDCECGEILKSAAFLFPRELTEEKIKCELEEWLAEKERDK